MRQLLNLEGTIVPTNKAYTEAFKNIGKSTAMYLGAIVLFQFGRGFVAGMIKYRSEHPQN